MYNQDWNQWFDAIYPLLRAILAMILAAIVLLIVIIRLPDGAYKQVLAKTGWIFLAIIFIIFLLT